MTAVLPLYGILTLVTVDLNLGESLSQSLLRTSFRIGLCSAVCDLGDMSSREFVTALLKDDEGCKNPLLSSVTELALHGIYLNDGTLCLCNALMKRTEQGVPLEALDLRMCYSNTPDAVRLLSEIVVDVLRPLDFQGPEDTEKSYYEGLDMLEKMITMWKPLSSHPLSDDEDGD